MNLIVLLVLLSSFSFLSTSCSSSEEFIVKHQVIKAFDTNCYLVYGERSKEAALIDIAGPIDSLITYIKINDLKLKYIICTHGHFDHLIGVPDIKRFFPDAKIVIHEYDYKDMFTQKEWALKNLDPEIIEYLRSDPESNKIFEFDVRTFGVPNILVEDNQTLKLGYSQLTAIHSPGHSPGSVCFQLQNNLFSGDVLFYRTVGRTDVQNSSRDDLIRSVKRLYELYSENLDVYPGHGQFTDLDSEKKENKYISLKGGEWVQ